MMRLRSTPAWIPYVAAAAAVSLAALIAYFLSPPSDTRILILSCFIAVIFSAWFGGFGPALLATVLSYLSAEAFFVQEKSRFVLDYPTVTFVTVCLAVAAFSEAMKRARRRAESSAQRVVSIVETITDGFIATDRQWKCTYMNRAAEELSHLYRQDALGKTPWEIFPSMAGDIAQAKLKQAATERLTVEFESFHESWNRWFEIQASFAEAGSLAIFFRDITERKLSQIALAESEERLRFALRGAKAGLWDRDIVTGRATWSDGYYEINGLDSGLTPSLENLLQAVHPDDRARVSESNRKTNDVGQNIDLEYRTVHPTQGVRWVAARGRTTRDNTGRPVRTSGIVLDITERKRAEETLRFLSEAGNVLAALVDFQSTIQRVASLAVRHFADWCVVDMISPLGQVDRVAFAHQDASLAQTLKDLLERGPLEWDTVANSAHVIRTKTPKLIGTLPSTFIDAVVRDDEHRRLLAKLAPASLMIVPLVARDKAIGTLTFVSAQPWRRYTQGDLELATELARRVATASDNARLYQELQEAQRQKDDFLAMLAHELRNPLAAIQYANQLAKMTESEDGAAADVIDRQVKNLAHLIDDLLDVSRITRDKIQLRKEVLDGSLLLQRAVATVRPMIEARHHQLITEIGPAPMPVHVDPVRVEQIFVNLLSNAAKYTPEGGRITVRCFEQDGQVVFKFKDSGIGIPVEMLPRVFELFTQVDRSLDRSQGGLGIGLTVVRKLAEMHGGSVSVTSEGAGRGSEFTVRLPMTEHTVEAPSEPETASTTAPLKVLIVDDNVDMAKSIGLLLGRLGHTISTAHDGPAALEAARAFSPDVILLDIGLPGLDGYRVAEALRREPAFANVRLIAVSGYGQAEDCKRAEAAGFDLHLVKPVDFAALVSALAGR
jgi:PAS domain S-box-containing protein